jgi:glycosyltransferase involved in cell wall biosynthesis
MRPLATVHGFVRASDARATLASAPIVLAASSFMREEAARHGAPAARTHLIPLPVAPAAQVATPPEPLPLILFASRLTTVKGPYILLDAFARMETPARLALAGSGNEDAAVAEAVRRHPRAAAIHLLGELDHGLVHAWMRRATVVVVPSLWPEPFGLVGVEALAEGRAVVASAVGGTSDWARESLGVLTVPPGDASVLAGALDRVLTEPTWGVRAALTGTDWAAAHHSLAAHHRALVTAFATAGITSVRRGA